MKTLTPSVLSTDFLQLSMLLHAGALPEEAVSMLEEDGQTLRPLRDALAQGRGFAEAVRDCGLFPAYAVDLIAVGERAGRLEECLRGLSGYYDHEVQLQKRLRSALVYPCVLLLLLCAILAVLVFAVMPVFTGVYQNLAGSLTGSSYAYVGAASVISRIGLIVTAVVCAAALLLVSAAGNAAFGLRIRRFLEKTPATGRALKLLSVSRLSDVLSTLLHSGADPEAAMETAAAMNRSTAIAPQLDACRAQMETGAGLAEALSAQKLFSPLRSRLLLTGSRSGNLAETLDILSTETGDEGQSILFRRIDLLEPFFTIFLTVAVGLTLLSAMLPLAGILGAIG